MSIFQTLRSQTRRSLFLRTQLQAQAWSWHPFQMTFEFIGGYVSMVEWLAGWRLAGSSSRPVAGWRLAGSQLTGCGKSLSPFNIIY